ncbi:hypothetical protein GOC45_30945 [Sinorhizobium meliloti]|uniref:polysaccharide pyruvyl transferase family protein n=1 Tax=Rhizobium meliloti TaxID=382 RepID=UPI000FD9D282|nr:polysaccharide pyruvyl transferase family protein [Sinorhizobium meliloti]MDX0309325.1 hypothetical protein [Sinorhizobium meliloti]RVK33092.1 polysaccharide pyruvyl transferase family protein [Sinorhizobium meliloti]
MNQKRILHFDLKTLVNYGDTLLFEAVKQVFNGFNNRNSFLLCGSRNLRRSVGPQFIGHLNSNFDAALVGGGGLFLKDANPNSVSGWQWNIRKELLSKIEVPLVLFAVGYNRFMGQEDFAPTFREHLNATIEKAMFVGLRNSGSIEALKRYLAPNLHDRLVFQPCPTTISSYLFPDIYKRDLKASKRVAFQITFEERHRAGGFDMAGLFRSTAEVIQKLLAEDWTVDVIVQHSHHDVHFPEYLRKNNINVRVVNLHTSFEGLYKHIEYYSDLPIVVGNRGHAQMIPFGMGSGIISILMHDKLGFFLDDIDHQHLGLNPSHETFSTDLYQLICLWNENFGPMRRALALKRQELYEKSLKNLNYISHNLGIEPQVNDVTPYTTFERDLSFCTFLASLERDEEALRLDAMRDKITKIKQIL